MVQSHAMFTDFYKKYGNKLEESDSTVFTNINILGDESKHYKMFLENTLYYDSFLETESLYKKNNIIKMFLENIILSNIYTNVTNTLIEENGLISFSNRILLENTVEQFNVKYQGDELIEESWSAALFGIGAGAMGGLATGLIAAGAVFSIQLLMPAVLSRNSDRGVSKLFSYIGLALAGTKSVIGGDSYSQKNIINLDNIDSSPEIEKMFLRLSRDNSKKAPFEGINTIVASCKDLEALKESSEIQQRGFLDRMYKPQYDNIFSIALKEVFRKSSNKESDEFNILLSFRKCLIGKLVELYKFLMITNISQNRDYKKIIRIMQKGFGGEPEHLLSFIHTEDETEEVNKEVLINLIRLRMHFDIMVKDLQAGSFQVDKESAIYFKQTLKVVDQELYDELHRVQKNIEIAFESRSEFDEKHMKSNKVEEKNLKRKFMGD